MSNSNAPPASVSASSRLVYGKNDVLFGAIETQQGDIPFGNVLDAGTGLHSLRWLATLRDKLGMKSFTAVTADPIMQKNVLEEAEALGVGDYGTVIVGNWFDPRKPLVIYGEKYDTIIADYLIGAMDGFSPYQQDQMIPKLASYLKPGGRLYIVGLQPIPDKASGAANIICRVRQIRDSCILLAGHRCYREYPVEWVQRQISLMGPKYQVLCVNQFPILYKYETILKQINVARYKLKYFPSKLLSQEMRKVLDDLDKQSQQAVKDSPEGRIRLGFDYVVSAERKSTFSDNGQEGRTSGKQQANQQSKETQETNQRQVQGNSTEDMDTDMSS